MIKAKDNKCPRCGGLVPNSSMVGKYPGALSRVADYEICSSCGEDEAMRDFAKQPPIGLGDWVINKRRKTK